MTKLGDIPDFNFSPVAINNINKLLKLVRERLASSSKAKSSDEKGNTIYVDIFSTDTLVAFLALSLSDFNQTPYFTNYSFEDNLVIDTFTEVLVEGAVLHALASKALIEKGREFKIDDNGVYLDPPNVSDMLNTQYSTLIQHHFHKLKDIKSTSQIFDFKKNKT